MYNRLQLLKQLHIINLFEMINKLSECLGKLTHVY